MGASHFYECKKCNKTINASLEETQGMISKVLAIKCNDCNFIGDSTIEYEDNKVEPICEECNSANVIKWDKRCPTCQEFMIDKGVYFHWD